MLPLTSTPLQQTISRVVRSDWNDGAAPPTAKQKCHVIVACPNYGGFASWPGQRANNDTKAGEVATNDGLLTLLVRTSQATRKECHVCCSHLLLMSSRILLLSRCAPRDVQLAQVVAEPIGTSPILLKLIAHALQSNVQRNETQASLMPGTVNDQRMPHVALAVHLSCRRGAHHPCMLAETPCSRICSCAAVFDGRATHAARDFQRTNGSLTGMCQSRAACRFAFP